MRTAVRLAVALAITALVATATPVAADHEHWLETPGTCVEDIASGQTSKLATDPGGHTFHLNVHTGTPGVFAFDGGPVSVGKVVDGVSCPSGEDHGTH
jgi:hypothetical protein